MIPVKYKKPRAINAVTIALLLVVLAAGHAAYEFVRVDFHRREAYRVLEETGSNFAGQRGYLTRDWREREKLRIQMQQRLREIGIDDPDAETWIEVDDDGAHFGVVYTAWYRWPFDVRAPIRRDIEVEHTLPATTW